MQPREPGWQLRTRRAGVTRGELALGTLRRFAQRGRLSADQGEIAVDPLQLVARSRRPRRGGFDSARRRRDLLTGLLELDRDPRPLSLALRTLGREL